MPSRITAWGQSALGLGERHARLEPEAARLVRARRDHAVADDDGLCRAAAGRVSCSTDAKNASMSRWSTSPIEHHRRQPPRQLVRVQAEFVTRRPSRPSTRSSRKRLLADVRFFPARVDARDLQALRAAAEHDRSRLARPRRSPHYAHANRFVHFPGNAHDPDLRAEVRMRCAQAGRQRHSTAQMCSGLPHFSQASKAMAAVGLPRAASALPGGPHGPRFRPGLARALALLGSTLPLSSVGPVGVGRPRNRPAKRVRRGLLPAVGPRRRIPDLGLVRHRPRSRSARWHKTPRVRAARTPAARFPIHFLFRTSARPAADRQARPCIGDRPRAAARRRHLRRSRPVSASPFANENLRGRLRQVGFLSRHVVSARRRSSPTRSRSASRFISSARPIEAPRELHLRLPHRAAVKSRRGSRPRTMASSHSRSAYRLRADPPRHAS